MKKIITLTTAILIVIFMICGCTDAGTPTEALPTEDISEETPAQDNSDIIIAEKGLQSDCVIIASDDNYGSKERAEELCEVLSIKYGTKLSVDNKGWKEKTSTNRLELILGPSLRPEYSQASKTLGLNEFTIKAFRDQETGAEKVVIAYSSVETAFAAIQYFTENYCKDDRCNVAVDTDITKENKFRMITSSIKRLRDPFILVSNGVYYAYGTGWQYYKNTSGSLEGEWEGPFDCVEVPEDAETDFWAPEVHVYKENYYMFTTYKSRTTGKRGVSVFMSGSPEGPFVEISDGHLTPKDWDSIDGTLYVDEEGQPWMIFVHEWVSTDDGVGRMDAMKLSDDLSKAISEPVELFRSCDAPWVCNEVTDGCFIYRTSGGRLLMLWSTWDKYGYCVGVAYSENGKPDGKWIHTDKMLYSKGLPGCGYDGGHGMIFTDTDGQMYLSIHSPNSAQEEREEKPVFIPIRESDQFLEWDYNE